METVVAQERTRGRLPVGALIASLTLGLSLPALADIGSAWDDSHMQSRFGGPRGAPLQARRIEGGNRFDPSSTEAPGTSSASGRLLPGSQHAWSQRPAGPTGASSAVGGSAAARRPQPRAETRHTRNPAAWSRSTQSSSLRAGAVRRSSAGR